VLTFGQFLDAGAGGYALGVMGFFLVILVVGLVYEWRKGGLEWQ
jgi:NADH:ubiquinone oxidoreductase subunit 3 (subunit A)